MMLVVDYPGEEANAFVGGELDVLIVTTAF